MSSPAVYPDWWNEDVEAQRKFDGSAENARAAQTESIKQFSDKHAAFDTRGKGAVATLFVLIGAAGYVVLQMAFPLLHQAGQRSAGAWPLLCAGMILFMNLMWMFYGKRILHAYYFFFVAAVVDSTKKHFAWGVASHQWHRYVLAGLAKNPQSQEQLIEDWMMGKNTLDRYYSRWLTWVSAASGVLGTVCFGVAAFVLWKGA
jgi:hypothetical protein